MAREQELEQVKQPEENVDDDLDDEGEDYVDDDDLEAMQERAISEFRRGAIDLKTPAGTDAFKTKYGACLMGNADCATLVHKIIGLFRKRLTLVDEFKPLLELVLALHPFILEVRDQQGETALHFAIRRGMSPVVEFLCRASSHGEEAIGCRGPDGGNCVHSAIARIMPVRSFLVDACHANALAACDVHGRTPLHLAVNYGIRALEAADADMVKRMIAKCPDALSVRDRTQMSPYQVFRETFEAWSKKHASIDSASVQVGWTTGVRKPAVTWITGVRKCAADLQQLQVEACMRHLSRADCIEALYGTSAGLAVEFDLEGITSLPGDQPLHSFEFLRFESVLRYVAIPPLTFSSMKKPSVNAAGQGRDDFFVVFNWLRAKGVKRILRVLVVDHQDRPHSDEVIEVCLAGFDVEELDWRKPNICSQSILTAAPNVRVLNLYSTGNNPVLRDWSSADGLVLLKQLKRVQVTVSQSLESLGRTRANLEAFSRRLLYPRARPDIDLYYTITSDLNAPGESFARQPGPERKRDWLEAFKALLGLTVRCAEICRSGQVQPVKIALIADGIDATEELLSGKLLAGRTFTSARDASDRMLAYYVSSYGHGTFLGKLVCKLLPMASFYVGKIQGTYIEDESGELLMNAGMVAQATEWAIQMRADIIVYGGLPVLDQDRKTDREIAQKRLEAIITKAKHSTITVLRPVATSSARSVPRFPSEATSYRGSGVGIQNGSITDRTHTSGAEFAIPGSSLRTAAEFKFVDDSVSNGRAALALGAALAATVVAMARTLGPGADPGLYMVDEAFTHLEKEMDQFLELPHATNSDPLEKTAPSEMLRRLADLGERLFGWNFFEALEPDPEAKQLESGGPSPESATGDSSIRSGSSETEDEA